MCFYSDGTRNAMNQLILLFQWVKIQMSDSIDRALTQSVTQEAKYFISQLILVFCLLSNIIINI